MKWKLLLKNTKNHPSINAITKRMKNLGNFNFRFTFISHDDVVKELNKLKSKKASQKTDIPVKIVKENVDISHFLYHNFNNSLSCSTFPTGMKYADVTPIHKKDDKTDKTNYRPMSILPNLSKVYERLMYNQISPYFDSVFSKFQFGFRKGFNAHHCLLAVVENWRKTLNEGGEIGVVLTVLSKALLFGVSQGSILGPLLFNIYICDMFFKTPENIDFAGYADDNTPYTYSSKIEHVLTNLQGALEKLFLVFCKPLGSKCWKM